MPRETQICPAEAVCAVVAAWHFQDRLRGRDILYWVDNAPALEALIKGTSPMPDIALIAELAQITWAHLHMRIWLEWVDSGSNQADGLSV